MFGSHVTRIDLEVIYVLIHSCKNELNNNSNVKS